MKNADKNSTENMMDINNNERESHECSKCGKEALYYNTDTEKWLCEDCKNEEDEIEKLAIKLEKKLSKRPYSFDLKELVGCLSKDEIYNIARNLGVTKISGLNKDKLCEKLVAEYKELTEKRLNLFEYERFDILKSYVDNNGVKVFDEVTQEEVDKSAYFIQQGMLYPTVKDEKSFFLMPTILQDVIKEMATKEHKQVLKSNSELINTYRGMNNAYGVLPVKDALALLGKYSVQEDLDLEGLLREASYFYNEFREDNGYFINNEIDNYEEVLNDIKKENVQEYASISKEELIGMSENEWVYESKAGKAFYKEFSGMFTVDKDLTSAMMSDLYLDVQEVEPKEAVDKMIELIKIENEDIKFVAAKMMNKFVNKLRLWRYKGFSTNELKSTTTTEVSKKVVGRNEPCPCGSGKKYKKCCGK